jgi:hypothetical protein
VYLFVCLDLSSLLFRSPKPQTPNPKPQTPNPKPLQTSIKIIKLFYNKPHPTQKFTAKTYPLFPAPNFSPTISGFLIAKNMTTFKATTT